MQVAFSSLSPTVVPASGLGGSGLPESAFFYLFLLLLYVSLMIVGKYPWMLINYAGVRQAFEREGRGCAATGVLFLYV